MFIFFAKKSEDWEGIYYVEEKPDEDVPDLVKITKEEPSSHLPYRPVPEGDLHDALDYIVHKVTVGAKSLVLGGYLITVMQPDLPWAKYKVIISET